MSATNTPGDTPGTPPEPAAGATSGNAIDKARARVEQVQLEAKAEIERAKHTVEEVKGELDAATDDRRGGPATSVEDALAKAEMLRQGMTRDLAALRSRVPETSETIDRVKKLAAIVGGGIAALTALALVLSKRSARRSERKQARQRAIDIAQELRRLDLGELRDAMAEVPMPPEESSGSKGRVLLALLGLAGIGVAAYQKLAGDDDVEDPFGPAV
jgi:hypothetical protein